MNSARRGDAMEARQPIGDDPSACAEVVLRPGGDFAETEALDDSELHAQRVSLLVGLDGGDKGRLAGRATTALAPTSLATEIGVVELDPATERVLAFALHHHLHQLVAHAPRRVVGDWRRDWPATRKTTRTAVYLPPMVRRPVRGHET